MTRKSDRIDFEIAFYESLVKDKEDFVDALIPLAHAYTEKGWFEKGLEIDRRLARLLKDDGIVHYNLACSLALLGKSREALRALRRALVLGYEDFEHLKQDPDLKSLHKMPEFKKILASIE
ncbi:MAG TPA: hypothetical protein VL688_08385 [Verrucomicrobiae bacterium]|jgi:tetratricopeptide (TPR) repeat protein|nr:hypothetical protein [Verrucomicrobiae bacterium]